MRDEVVVDRDHCYSDKHKRTVHTIVPHRKHCSPSEQNRNHHKNKPIYVNGRLIRQTFQMNQIVLTSLSLLALEDRLLWW